MKLKLKFYYSLSQEIENLQVCAKNVPFEFLESVVTDLEICVRSLDLTTDNHYTATLEPVFEYGGAGGQYFSEWDVKEVKCTTVLKVETER